MLKYFLHSTFYIISLWSFTIYVTEGEINCKHRYSEGSLTQPCGYCGVCTSKKFDNQCQRICDWSQMNHLYVSHENINNCSFKDYCASKNNKCKRLGFRCFPLFGSYKCQCPKRFFGQYCEHEIGNYSMDYFAKISNIIYTPMLYASSYAIIIIYMSHLGRHLHIEIDNGREILEYNKKKCNTFLHASQYCSSWFDDYHAQPSVCDSNGCGIFIKQFFPRVQMESKGDFILDSDECTNNERVVGKREHVSVKIFNIIGGNIKQPVSEHNFTMINIYIARNRHANCSPMIHIKKCGNNMKVAPKFARNKMKFLRSSVRLSNKWYCKNAGKIKMKWKSWKLGHNHDEINDAPLDVQLAKKYYKIKPFSFDYGIYKLKLTASVYINNILNSESTYGYFQIVHIPWKPVIIGGNIRHVYYNNDIVLDASNSRNPNIKLSQQQHPRYLWKCNDTAVLFYSFVKLDPIFTIPGPFTAGKVYNFELTFISGYETISATTNQIVVMSNNPVPNLIIECLQNCAYEGIKSKSNPAEVLYLKVSHLQKTRSAGRNNKFYWSYTIGDSKSTLSVDKIKQHGTPSNVVIVKRGSLKEGQQYVFRAKGGGKIPGEADLRIDTCHPLKIGTCVINPESGVRGKTQFDIICHGFKGEDEMSSPNFEFYDRYQEQNKTRLLESNSIGLIYGVILTGGKVIVKVYDACGMSVILKINVKLKYEINITDVINNSFRKLLDITNYGDLGDKVRIVSAIGDMVQNWTDNYFVVEHLLKILAKEEIKDLADVKMMLFTLETLLDKESFTNMKCGCPCLNYIATVINTLSQKLLFCIGETEYRYTNSGLTSEDISGMSLSLVRCAIAVLATRDDKFANKSYKFTDNKYNCFEYSSRKIVYSLNNMIHAHTLRLLPFMKEYILNTEEISVWVKEDTPLAIGKTVRSFRNQTIKLPWSLTEYLSNVSNLITFQLVTFKLNPYWWSPGEINTNVVSLKLSYKSDMVKTISALKYPTDIYLKNMGYEVVQISGTATQPDPKLRADKTDSAISVHQIHPKEGSKTFIKFIGVGEKDIFRVLVLCNFRPDYEVMVSRALSITNESSSYAIEYNYTVEEPIYYVGILPGPDVEVGTGVNYKFQLYSARCQVWKHNVWSTHGCVVGKETIADLLHCQCKHLSTFGGVLEVPVNMVNPFDEFSLFLTVLDNPLVVILVLSILLFYAVFFHLVRIRDTHDNKMQSVILLEDNFPGDKYGYLVTVFTGSRLGSGTTSNVGIKLIGTKCPSRAHILSCANRPVLKINHDDWFILFTIAHLGILTNLQLWHDFSGSSPNWYCDKIVVYELKTKLKYVFLVERWLGMIQSYACLEAVVPSANLKKLNLRSRLSIDNTILGFRESHLWASVLSKHPRSTIMRTQRLSIATSAAMITLLTSIMFYGVLESQNEDYPNYSVSNRELVIGMYSFLISTCLDKLITISFSKSYILHKTEDMSYDQLDQLFNINPNENLAKSTHIGKISLRYVENVVKKYVKRKRFLPVQYVATTTPVNMRKKWFICAWLLCAVTICGSAFLITLIGLKFGKLKSFHWLTSAGISLVQGTLITSPAKIILFSVFIGMMDSQLYDVVSYDSKIQHIQPNVTLLNDEFLRKLIKIRALPMYRPLNRDKIKVLCIKEDVITQVYLLLDFSVILVFSILLLIKIRALHLAVYYAANSHISSLLTMLKGAPTTNFEKINSLPTFIVYLQTVVFPVLYSTEWYNGQTLTVHGEASAHPGWISDASHKIIGVPQLRQLRVKRNLCTTGEGFDNSSNKCYTILSTYTEDRNSYKTGWKSNGWDDTVFDMSPWVYHSDSESFSVSLYGSSGMLYPGGGYVAELKHSHTLSNGVITNLIDTSWFDELTHVLFFELTVYNANSNVFTFVVLITEKIPVGYFTTKKNTWSLQISTIVTLNDKMLIGCLSYFLLKELLVMNRIGVKQFIRNVWNLYNILFIFLGAYCIIMLVTYIRAVNNEKFQHTGKYSYFRFLPIFNNFKYIHTLFITLFTCTVVRLLRSWRFGTSHRVYNTVLLLSSSFALSSVLLLLICTFGQIRLITYLLNVPGLSYFNQLITYKFYFTSLLNHSPFQNGKLIVFFIYFCSNIVIMLLAVNLLYHYKTIKEDSKDVGF